MNNKIEYCPFTMCPFPIGYPVVVPDDTVTELQLSFHYYFFLILNPRTWSFDTKEMVQLLLNT